MQTQIEKAAQFRWFYVLIALCILSVSSCGKSDEATPAKAEVEKKTAGAQGEPLTWSDIPDLRAKAEGGNAEAQYNLGVLTQAGQGVEKNSKEAFKWFTKAAHQDHAAAQFMLGGMYAGAQGTPSDLAEARNWFRKAALKNVATAQLFLGLIYLRGDGVDPDAVQALAWFKLAAEQNNSDAKEACATVEDTIKLTPDQLSKADALMREFKKEIENTKNFASGNQTKNIKSLTSQPSDPNMPNKHKLDVPFAGSWTVMENLGIHIYYSVSCQNESGTIEVEAGGDTVRRLNFDITGPNSIRIRGAKRGVYKAEKISIEQMAALARLDDPPQELVLSTKPPPMYRDPETYDHVYVQGFWENLPFKMDRVGEAMRVALPFTNVIADLDIKMPQATIRFTDGEFGNPNNMRFDKPSHPAGKVKSLKVENHEIALETFEIREGMVTTKDFGSIELVMNGPSQVEARATLAQIRKIRESLKKQRK